jgi:hypothetical protein
MKHNAFAMHATRQEAASCLRDENGPSPQFWVCAHNNNASRTPFYPRVRPPTLTPRWAPAGLTVELRLAGEKLLFLDRSSLKRSSLRADSQLEPSSVFNDSIFCLYKSVVPAPPLVLSVTSCGECGTELPSSSSDGSWIRGTAVGVLKEVSRRGLIGVVVGLRACVVGAVV